MSSVKRLIKRLAIRIAHIVGPRLFKRGQRRWLCDRVTPYLLDERVLPRGLIERPLRRVPVRVWCDPYVHTHRDAYWCGVSFEEDVESYLLREIRPGDTVIDVGANVGHVCIPAATLVGPSGRVLAFEPNPELVQLTGDLAARQGLNWLCLHNFALGEEPAEGTLHVNPMHPGRATLRNIAEDTRATQALFSHKVRCEVRVGDRAFADEQFTGRVCLKVDVEGFEMQVLRGMRHTLTHRVDHAIIEVTPRWIGGLPGVEAMFAFMRDAGLNARVLNRDGTVGSALLSADVQGQINVVFRREGPPGTLRHPAATTQPSAVPGA